MNESCLSPSACPEAEGVSIGLPPWALEQKLQKQNKTKRVLLGGGTSTKKDKSQEKGPTSGKVNLIN